MAKSTIFKANKTQAVRLPGSLAFPEHVNGVVIIKRGAGRLIVPESKSWDEFFNGPRLDRDFLSDRDQPAPQGRKPR